MDFWPWGYALLSGLWFRDPETECAAAKDDGGCGCLILVFIALLIALFFGMHSCVHDHSDKHSSASSSVTSTYEDSSSSNYSSSKYDEDDEEDEDKEHWIMNGLRDPRDYDDPEEYADENKKFFKKKDADDPWQSAYDYWERVRSYS